MRSGVNCSENQTSLENRTKPPTSELLTVAWYYYFIVVIIAQENNFTVHYRNFPKELLSPSTESINSSLPNIAEILA